MTLSISMWNIQGLNSSAFGLKSLNTEFQKEHQGDGHYNSTGDMEQGRRNHPPNYREIILPSQKLSTFRQGRDSGGQIIWYKSKFHNHINTVKQGKYYTWLKSTRNCSHPENIYSCCHIHPAIRVPLLQRRHVLTLEEETSHFQAQGNVLICGDLNARTGLQAGLHRHTREQQTDCY